MIPLGSQFGAKCGRVRRFGVRLRRRMTKKETKKGTKKRTKKR